MARRQILTKMALFFSDVIVIKILGIGLFFKSKSYNV